MATRGSSTAHSKASVPCTELLHQRVVVSMEWSERRLWLGRWWVWLAGLYAQRLHAANMRVAMGWLGWLLALRGPTEANPDTSLHSQHSVEYN